jgi:hypothetical protein
MIMKRALLFFAGLIVVLLISVYVFIPGRIRTSYSVVIRCTPAAISPFLHHYKEWKLWWPLPYNMVSGDSSFMYKKYNYKLITPLTDGVEIEIVGKGDRFNTRILLISLGTDSVRAEWQITSTSGIDPFKRINMYSATRDLKNNISELLENLHAFGDKTENIYGFHIERTTFTDTILAATKFMTDTYPTNEIIYRAVDQLKKKIKAENALEKDFPMLNVMKTDSNYFKTMIAICVNKEIKNEKNIFMSRMVNMKDRFLKTEVTGGPFTIKKAHQAIENYMNDHFLSAPAIPFEILVTDRSKEADTSKWKTIIFHPSM